MQPGSTWPEGGEEGGRLVAAGTPEEVAGTPGSALADDDRRRMDALRARLERAVGRPVDLVSLASAATRPLLFHDALTEGRVLVDREARWPVLLVGGRRGGAGLAGDPRGDA